RSRPPLLRRSHRLHHPLLHRHLQFALASLRQPHPLLRRLRHLHQHLQSQLHHLQPHPYQRYRLHLPLQNLPERQLPPRMSSRFIGGLGSCNSWINLTNLTTRSGSSVLEYAANFKAFKSETRKVILCPEPKMCDYIIADDVLLKKQRDVLRLLKHVHQPSYFKELEVIAKDFDFTDLNQWTKPEYPEKFWNYYQEGLIQQDEVFSVYNPTQVKYAEALFKVFFYARTYHVFYKAAAWARQKVNPGMFVYCLSVAIVHGKHTVGVVLPPVYETVPHYFFPDRVIRNAQQLKQRFHGDEKQVKSHVIDAMYSDSCMSYLTEDVGFNSYYYYKNVYMPYWLEEECMSYDGTNRGEWFQYYHNQILARYYLERLANGKGRIPHLDYREPIKSAFNPSLTYPNGQPFPNRQTEIKLHLADEQTKDFAYCYSKVEDYERRLRDAVDQGFVLTPKARLVNLFDDKGFETLGRLVECDPESPHNQYYGNVQIFARHLLGQSKEFLPPSALGHFETSLRDPMFYQIYKKLMRNFHERMNKLPSYKPEELLFDGVKIEDVETDRLETFFDYHYADLANAVTVNQTEFVEDTFQVQAKQMRFNHRPFNYRIVVKSEIAEEALVKVFLGPKFDELGKEINIKENYMNFFELDRFKCSLSEGSNTIERRSDEIMYFSQDRTTVKTFTKQIEDALGGKESYKSYPYYKFYTFPQRLMLPKGESSGKPFKLLVVLTKYHAPEDDSFADFLVDTQYSMNYPFDRPINVESHFWVPNFHTKDVLIYHSK
ncbi:PREDICTED: allergen Cr-PI-like, partial [Nicrophorus vespilloides]|uniref:Allergen Cr-PI-like n=1 Tax=Nicrophorus vespilloides TaxID=110193 RepID=A0ABM1MG59_NICVS